MSSAELSVSPPHQPRPRRNRAKAYIPRPAADLPVVDDWPDFVPVGNAERDVLETFCGTMLTALLEQYGPGTRRA